MYEHVKTGCKHIPPSEQPLQFQSGYYLNKPRIYAFVDINNKCWVFVSKRLLNTSGQSFSCVTASKWTEVSGTRNRLTSYPTQSSHKMLILCITQSETKKSNSSLSRWIIGRWLKQGLHAKTIRDPSFRKYLQFCLRINVPPPQRPRFINCFTVVVKCFSIYLMNFLLRCSQVTRTGEQSFNAR